MCLLASVMSNSLQHYGPWPARLLCPWDSPGKDNGVGCHFLLKIFNEKSLIIEENNKRGKTRDVFRKTGNIKGTFCQKMSTG